MVVRPWFGSTGDRYWNSTSTPRAPFGTVTLKAYTLTGSRCQASGWPLALTLRPANWLSAPLGPWLPGIHCGYSSVSLPGRAGMVWRTRKMFCAVSEASTFRTMVPG